MNKRTEGKKLASFMLKTHILTTLEEAKWYMRMPKQDIVAEALEDYFKRNLDNYDPTSTDTA